MEHSPAKGGPRGRRQRRPVAAAQGVSTSFGATKALIDAHIEIQPGEAHALVGRNGAGKSTLVSLLTGLNKPDTGRITFDGEPPPSLYDRAGWQRKVACVYQKSTTGTRSPPSPTQRPPPKHRINGWSLPHDRSP